MYTFIEDNFYSRAPGLRSYFEGVFENPHRARAERFCWDFWHVPRQYTLLRTPAYQFFPQAIYEPFHRYLVKWGRENLGCHDISPTWLSCYVEGCRQEIHRDLPHGPLAFVFSLTRWKQRRFSGGETFLLTGDEQALEREDLLTEIEPKFNRLTLFDPSIPHGVNEVRGVQDPAEGRLVIHGWFVQPRPFLVGGLRAGQVQQALEGQLPEILERALPPGSIRPGFASFRLIISRAGKVQSVEALVDTAGAARPLRKALFGLTFPGSNATTRLTLPIQCST